MAQPNFRSLHKQPIPSGGGIIISFVYISSTVCFIFLENISSDILFKLAIGGLAASIFGLMDDVIEVRTTTKLLVQIMLSVWILFIFSESLQSTFDVIAGKFYWPFIVISVFFLVWLSNVFNFMDGIDGMLTSESMLITFSAALIILLVHGGGENTVLLFLLGIVCLGFLLFNFPPASIFIGNAGSMFLGYLVGCIIFKTIIDNDINVWTWLIILGHFLSETTLTTVMRIKLTKNWYKPHRSHAYQNLARIWDSHKLVTIGSMIFHLFWLFPLALISAFNPEVGFILFLLAVFPVVLLTLRYGPLFSNT